MLNSSLKQLRKIYKRQFKQLFSSQKWHSKSFRRKIYGFFYLTVIIGLFFWNWTLLLATSAGVGMMAFTYIIQGWNWENYYSEFHQWFQDFNSRFSVSVGIGGLSAFIVYLVTTIWLSSENRWLATGAILQGLITLLIAGLLLWQSTHNQKLKNRENFEQLLDNLTSTNQLKRLITIRKLTDLFLQNRLNESQQKQLNDYFQIMLSYEQEIILQKALLESLEDLNCTKKPLQIPLNFSKTPAKIKLKQVETSLDYE